MKLSILLLFGAAVAVAAAPHLHPHPGSAVRIPSSRNAQPLVADVVGYSIEPNAVNAYSQSKLGYNVLESIKRIAGKAVPIRIGGTTSDEIAVVSSVNDSQGGIQTLNGSSSGGSTGAAQILITPRWYSTWADYFPKATEFVYVVNFVNTTDNWHTAQQQTKLALSALGRSLRRIELGNEVDHYINKGWRNTTWGISEYVQQYRSLTKTLKSLAEFEKYKPQFQAAVFADPPDVPDQQDEIDDFGIVNLTRKGHLTNRDGSISSYAVHLYPQSTCDDVRRARLSLDLLSNHSVLYKNVSQYVPSVAAAEAAGAPLVLGETNSVSCGGKSGISDTFGAALWTLDYVLLAASLGVRQVFFHLGHQSEYSAFTPLSYEYKGERLEAGVRANLYGHLMVAHALHNEKAASIKAINTDGMNPSNRSVYAIYNSQHHLSKLVLLDMGVWNASTGISNPSTLSATDSRSVSDGSRAQSTIILDVSPHWPEGAQIQVLRLQAPGTNAKSLVSVSGQSFDSKDGMLQTGSGNKETLRVGKNGTLSVPLQCAEAVLLSRG